MLYVNISFHMVVCRVGEYSFTIFHMVVCLKIPFHLNQPTFGRDEGYFFFFYFLFELIETEYFFWAWNIFHAVVLVE